MSQNIMLQVRCALGKSFPKIQASKYSQDGHKGTAYTFSGMYGPQTFSISEEQKPVVYFFHMGHVLRDGLFEEYKTSCVACVGENDIVALLEDLIGETGRYA